MLSILFLKYCCLGNINTCWLSHFKRHIKKKTSENDFWHQNRPQHKYSESLYQEVTGLTLLTRKVKLSHSSPGKSIEIAIQDCYSRLPELSYTKQDAICKGIWRSKRTQSFSFLHEQHTFLSDPRQINQLKHYWKA